MAKNDFKEIVSFIELVPSDYAWPEESSENDSEMKDLVYAVLITNNSKNDISAYYKELNSKYDAFLAKHESALPDDLLQSYNSMLRILENAINVDTVKAELEAAYSRGGVDGAMEYYNNKVECEHENDVLEMVCDEEKDYYDVVLAEYAGAVDYDVRVNSKQAYFVGRFQDYYTLIRLSNVAKKINKEMLGALNG